MYDSLERETLIDTSESVFLWERSYGSGPKGSFGNEGASRVRKGGDAGFSASAVHPSVGGWTFFVPAEWKESWPESGRKNGCVLRNECFETIFPR
jgi:hypothetical protein